MSVKEGDTVFVVDLNKFDIIEGVVSSSPDKDHLWVVLSKKKSQTFVGALRWDTTRAGAVNKAKSLLKERIEALTSETAALNEQLKKLVGKAS